MSQEHTYTIKVTFSEGVLADARDVAQRHGAEAGSQFLERMIDKALDGPNFEGVEIEALATKADPSKPRAGGLQYRPTPPTRKE